MSGIAGIRYLDGRPVRDEIDRMIEAMEYRGPDDQSTWTDNSVGLGHCMLETTPEDQYESLPLVDQTGIVITADARIDNRKKLFEDLDVPKPKDRSITDTELILASYKRWGQDCPDKLLGVFSFAVWDPQKSHFFCTRDQLGIKPIYYHYTPNKLFAFSSEISPLLEIEEISSALNETRIADELGYLREDVEQTYFEEISRLPPAHRMISKAGRIQKSRYWHLDPHREISFSSERECIQKFKSLFLDSVNRRARRVGSLGAMLSGGLDSSSVACAAHHTPRVNGEAVHTFSAVFDGVPESDEKAYIKSVLDKYNFVSHFFRGDKLNPLSPFFSCLSNTIDEPLRAANIHINWEAFNKAQDHSVRVILDGFDGDTTVSHGIGVLTQYAYEGLWGTFARELNAYTSNMGKSFWSMLWPYIRHFVVRPVLHRTPGYRLFRQSIISGNDENHDSPFGRNDLIDPNFALQMDWRDRRDSFETGRGGAFKAHREQHHHYLTSGKMPAALETIDRAAARFRVEVRFPFWDRQLVEFCLALPPQLKFGDGWTRRVHRLGMDGILPSEVQWRRDKSNVGMAFDQQLFRCNQKELERLVCGPTTRVSDFVNMDVVKQCYNKLRGGEVEGLESYHVWNAFTLDTWLSHIDGLRQSKN